MKLPKSLIDFVKDGQAVLFLGSGASVGALHPDGNKPPVGDKLSMLLAEKFLGKEYVGRSLSQIAELSISETNLFDVQEYIASIFSAFKPADFHKLIPTFCWQLIATTNYDLILERAYSDSKVNLQDLVPIIKNGDRIEEKIRSRDSVLYFKLHGCITNINDPNLHLILTPDQYITHKNNRSRLFERLVSFAYEYPFLFIGHSLSDIDIRMMLLELEQLKDARPRSYVISPEITEPDKRFWESKRITCIEGTFEEFLKSLESSIPKEKRVLAKLKDSSLHPVSKHFVVSEPKLSSSLETFLDRDVEYIHKGYKTVNQKPESFYKGYFVDWTPIVNDLDVKRTITDDILQEIFLSSEEEKSDKQEFYLIKGHAGSGKTVILRRLAWAAATLFEKICLSVRSSSYPSYEPLLELYSLCKERIFLFMDPAADHAEFIESFLVRARRDDLPLTIISAERNHEWNTSCQHLDSFLTGHFEVRYLSEKEIGELLELLEKHNSLGHLVKLSPQERVEALSKKAGRQLLVALHEATLGKPFEDIIYDEFQSIVLPQAKSMYLTISILHRLGVSTRAGLISRVHGISFHVFKEKFFKPLEYIVFVRENELIRDYIYETRHPIIAEMVFERVLTNLQDRFDEYIRIINELDIDYNSDRDAFKGFLSAKSLKRIFPDHQMIRQLYKAAKGRAPEDPMLLQQEAMFEMSIGSGNLKLAEDLLEKASKKATKAQAKAITHSKSELYAIKAEQSKNEVEKKFYRAKAKQISIELAEKSITSHPYHTLIKIEIDELIDLMIDGDETTLERKIKVVEENIIKALKAFPDDSYLLDSESKLCELIQKYPKALDALKRAVALNKRSPYIASRLASMYEYSNHIEDAISVLKECLELNPSSKDINFKIAILLMKVSDTKNEEILYHLRRSFTEGDTNYHAQFWYARYLYLNDKIEDAIKIFKFLSNTNIDIRLKREPRGKVLKDGSSVTFSGKIINIESSYCFIGRDGIGDRLFAYRYNNEKEWEEFSPENRVTFELAFNYRGPIAVNVKREK